MQKRKVGLTLAVRTVIVALWITEPNETFYAFADEDEAHRC